MTSPSPAGRPAGRHAGSLGRAFLAVAWSFFGVRRSSDLERDLREVKPAHAIVAALVAALLFVFALVFLVRWVVASGVAA